MSKWIDDFVLGFCLLAFSFGVAMSAAILVAG
jgi:hypothetical protein